jgi:hypothetical protein
MKVKWYSCSCKQFTTQTILLPHCTAHHTPAHSPALNWTSASFVALTSRVERRIPLSVLSIDISLHVRTTAIIGGVVARLKRPILLNSYCRKSHVQKKCIHNGGGGGGGSTAYERHDKLVGCANSWPANCWFKKNTYMEQTNVDK